MIRRFAALYAQALLCAWTYSFQTFSVGQVLTAAQMNQVEVNIRDHVHGSSGVSQLYGGNKNRLTNGHVLIDQDNVGAVVTVNSGTLKRSADMWTGLGTASAGVFTLTRAFATPPAGFKSYLHVAVTTADATPAVGARYLAFNAIEGYDVMDFALGTSSAKTFTLSFWVRSSLTGTFSGAFENMAINRSYPYTYTINSADTWEQKTVTVVGDTTGTWAIDNTVGLYVGFCFGSGSTFLGTSGAWAGASYDGATGSTRLISTNSATMDITGVQVELGSGATAFDLRDISAELRRCQRYLNKSFDVETAPGTATYTGEVIGFFVTNVGNAVHDTAGGCTFSTPMRIAPTMTFYSPVTGTAGKAYDNNNAADVNATLPHIGERGFVWEASASAPNASIDIGLQWKADARLGTLA